MLGATLTERLDNTRVELRDRKGDSEKILELVSLGATLTERLDNTRVELRELKRELEAARFKFWLVVPPVVAALLTVALTTLVNYLTRP